MYLKWVGMVNKVKDFVNPLEIHEKARKFRFMNAGQQSEDDEDGSSVEIPDVPLTLELSLEQSEQINGNDGEEENNDDSGNDGNNNQLLVV
jgi:hypothetical protein